MSVRESKVNQKMVRFLRDRFPTAVIFKHADHITSGIPDVSFSYNGKTTWIEVKRGDNGIIDTGLQHLTMKQLSMASSAIYVIFVTKEGRESTSLVHPVSLSRWESEFFIREEGINFEIIADFLNDLHS